MTERLLDQIAELIEEHVKHSSDCAHFEWLGRCSCGVEQDRTALLASIGVLVRGGSEAPAMLKISCPACGDLAKRSAADWDLSDTGTTFKCSACGADITVAFLTTAQYVAWNKAEAASAARIAQLRTLREKIWTGADQQTIANWLNELDALLTPAAPAKGE